MSSYRTPLGRGDYDPPDDEHVRGVDWDYCAWCGDDGWMPGSRWARPAGVMALATTDANLPACPDCIETGVADTHPDEADVLTEIQGVTYPSADQRRPRNETTDRGGPA